MGLTLRKESKWWYGRYYIDGKQIVKRLDVKVTGTRPMKLAELGDAAFERSRIRAEVAFDGLMGSINTNKSEEQLAQAVYEARAGRALQRWKINEMSQIWMEKPRRRPPSFEHQQQVVAKLVRVSEFINKNYPKLTRVDQLRYEHIKAFLDDLEKSGIAAETWNKYLTVIKSVLKRAGVPAAADIIARDADTVFREPFSIDELHVILEAAKKDTLIYNLSVTAATTAMRRKDCCFLRWESVDFDEGFITVKTSKTGVEVDIPMADLLIGVLRAQENNNSEYVFPEAKELYESSPTLITRRFKTVLRLAGFNNGTKLVVEYKTDPHTSEEILQAADMIYKGKKLTHAKSVLKAYLNGESISKSAKYAGVSQGTASLYLNELEAHLGTRFIRGKCRPVEGVAVPDRGGVRKERKNGKLAASVRDFHSFRTTWVTLALMNGMPIETVRKVTGHQTASIVTKHYFKPHRKELKKAMQENMPGLLTTKKPDEDPAEQALHELGSISSKMTKLEILKRVESAVALLKQL